MTTANSDILILEPNRPPNTSVIFLHGLGADAHDFECLPSLLRLPEEIAVRYILPHAQIRPITLSGGMPMRAWFDVYGLTPADPFDDIGIQAAQTRIHTLIDTEIKRGMPSNRILLGGFSQGGMLAINAGISYQKPLAGIMGLSTYFLYNENLVKNYTTINRPVPILMMHGTDDDILSIEMAKLSKNKLTDLGYQVNWHQFPMAHTLCDAEMQILSQWMTKILSHTA